MPAEPEATRQELITERLNRAVAVAVTGQQGPGRIRTNLLIVTVGICLALAAWVPAAVVVGLVALLLLALEGKK
jgi:hypothetical protein